MKTQLYILLLLATIGCKNSTKTENATEKETEGVNVQIDPHEPSEVQEKKLNKPFISNGIWVSTSDSLSTVEIHKDRWVFNYINGQIETKGSYNYQIADYTLNQEKSVIDGKLKVFNASDTLTYGIDLISKNYISIIYLPRGNFQRYRKKK